MTHYNAIAQYVASFIAAVSMATAERMASLQERFRGCLLGAAMGDIAGAPVEAESPQYIARTYRSIDQILSVEAVPEWVGRPWRVGRFTDDTQMMICVAEWLLDGPPHTPESLLARFATAYEPDQRYGPGTEGILRAYPQHRAQWRELSTTMFPHGSYGNGSAMRAAPVGLAYFGDLKKAASVAIESSRPTHSHPLAYQGAVLQAVSVATAIRSGDASPQTFLNSARIHLQRFADLQQDTTPFSIALDAIEDRPARGLSCSEMSAALGTGISAHESVPMALYCFLRHPDSFQAVLHEAIFAGGDTDTIACMAGAISGAFLGETAVPQRWLTTWREEAFSIIQIQTLADHLLAKYAADL